MDRPLGCATRLKMCVEKVEHLSRVYKIFHDTPCSGKEKRSQREMNSMKFSQPVNAEGHSFDNLKLTLSKKTF
jgi:hypothetical protein